MKLGKVFVLLMCCISLGYSPGFAAGPKLRYTGTFSSLEYHQEGGDLLGVEIKIVPTRKGYQGVLQIAEGGPSQLMIVDVSFEKDTERFEIPKTYSEYGGGIFEGKISSKGIRGAFKFNGVPGDRENLIRKSSYWDK